jgi:curli biogenesis system outer membrane secretion channel CsgG
MSPVRSRAAAVAVLVVLALSWPTNGAGQGKPRIAVSAFENKVKTPWWDPSWRIGEGLAEMLTTELARTGQFIVVERQALGDVVREQELGQSGLVRGETAAGVGQILGAQIVVRGAVTEFEARASGGGAGVRAPEVGVQAGVQNAHVGLDIRLIDTATGQVLASHNASRVVPAVGGAFGARVGGVAFGGDAFYQTPIGQATRGAIQDAVRFIMASAFRPVTPSFSIVKVEGNRAYLNAGASAGVRVGHVFAVHSRGEDLVDPETGLVLGRSEELVGSILVTDVQDRFSIATIRSGAGAIKRGDRARPE